MRHCSLSFPFHSPAVQRHDHASLEPLQPRVKTSPWRICHPPGGGVGSGHPTAVKHEMDESTSGRTALDTYTIMKKCNWNYHLNILSKQNIKESITNPKAFWKKKGGAACFDISLLLREWKINFKLKNRKFPKGKMVRKYDWFVFLGFWETFFYVRVTRTGGHAMT